MKTFSTSGTGSGQTLSEIESDKIPIYATESDAETDLTNLNVGQIIAIITIGAERLAYVVNENGTKKIKDLTANVGTGAPVGSYLYLEKKSNPQGYLYCDGSTFDETVYPALYQYLGTNVLPDWRELGAKGAEKNTTLIFDSTETDPSTGQAGKQNHDVFTQGEFKDDQLQDHRHKTESSTQSGDNGGISLLGRSNTGYTNIFQVGNIVSYSDNAVLGARRGTVTRGKSRAVFIYIKATSGLTENQQENVLNTINENLSYSTTEHKTGKKWIDGKDIWSKVVDCGALPNTTSKTVSAGLTNENVIKMEGVGISNSYNIPIPYDNSLTLYYNNTSHSVVITATSDKSSYTQSYITLEYTKTTDN